MYCPRCGTENADSNRFCVNCGSELSPAGQSSGVAPSLKQRLASLIGTTPRARLITAATVIAIVVGIVAFLSLDADEDATGSSPYLQKVDQECVAEKERIIALEEQTLSQQPPNLREFASVLVGSLAEWRANLRQDPPPPSSAPAIEQLEAALIKALIRSGELARAIRDEKPAGQVSRDAGAVDDAAAQLDTVIADLGLSACADLPVSPAENQP